MVLYGGTLTTTTTTDGLQQQRTKRMIQRFVFVIYHRWSANNSFGCLGFPSLNTVLGIYIIDALSYAGQERKQEIAKKLIDNGVYKPKS
jgi:hypothetical protein